MKNKILTDIFAIVSALAGSVMLAAPAAAQSPVSLKGDVKVERAVVSDAGSETVLAEPNDVVPGDRLRFATDYSNESGKAVDNFVVTNPLPAAVMLAEEEDSFEVSVDGGQNWGRLGALTVADAESGTRQAALADVTHIRWTLARLEPGASGSLSYHAIVR